jgi:hypothetical protein
MGCCKPVIEVDGQSKKLENDFKSSSEADND